MLEKITIPCLTFVTDNSVDKYSNINYIKLINQSGVKSIILFGTTGEGVLLSLEDKLDLLKIYIDHLDESIDIIMCPSTWSIKDIDNLASASDRISKILFLPNIYFARNDPTLLGYLGKISKVTGKDIYLYNLPKNTGFNFSPENISLYKEANIKVKGIKLSHTDIEQIKNYKTIAECEVLYGSDRNISEAVNIGADFVVSQNLSAAICYPNIYMDLQGIANKVRDYVNKESGHKIQSLKRFLRLNSNSGYPVEVL